jgi:hypothetical protein
LPSFLLYWPGQDYQDRTSRTGHPGQDIQDKNARSGLLGDRTARKGSIEQDNHDGQDKPDMETRIHGRQNRTGQ